MKFMTDSRDGFAVYILENERISVSVMPELGGKIVSLYDREKDFEVLFQNPKPQYLARRPGDAFSDHDASGFDDAFPNVDPSEEEIAGKKIRLPDHGEIWTAKLQPEPIPGGLRLRGSGSVLQYDYEKNLTIRDNTLCLSYRITNREAVPIPCLWTMHCLVRCDRDTRFLLPPETRRVRNLFPGPYGEPRLLSVHEHPELFAPPPEGTMAKYWLTEPIQNGECGYLFPRRGIRLMLEYPAERLPYLGLWCTMGGYRGDHNAALEPSTGYYDSVPTARENGALPMLAPGESFPFSLTLRLEHISPADRKSND